jgi:hypothetical protein
LESASAEELVVDCRQLSTPVGTDEEGRPVFASVRFNAPLAKAYISGLKKYLEYLEENVMTDRILPPWIKKMKEDQDAAKASTEKATLQAALVTQTANAEGPKFWERLLKELRFNADSLDEIGWTGQIEKLASNPEEAYRISVLKRDAIPTHAYVNLDYQAGASGIRCWFRDGKGSELQFCLQKNKSTGGNELMVIADGATRSAENLAEHLLQTLIHLQPNSSIQF